MKVPGNYIWNKHSKRLLMSTVLRTSVLSRCYCKLHKLLEKKRGDEKLNGPNSILHKIIVQSSLLSWMNRTKRNHHTFFNIYVHSIVFYYLVVKGKNLKAGKIISYFLQDCSEWVCKSKRISHLKYIAFAFISNLFFLMCIYFCVCLSY